MTTNVNDGSVYSSDGDDDGDVAGLGGVNRNMYYGLVSDENNILTIEPGVLKRSRVCRLIRPRVDEMDVSSPEMTPTYLHVLNYCVAKRQ